MNYRWGFNNLDYNDQFYVSSGGFEKTKTGHTYGPLGRSGYMIHCVTAGHGTFVSNNHKYHLGKGSMFFIQPHKTIAMRADSEDPWSFYWIRFIGNLVPKYMKRINLSYKNPVMSQKNLPGVFNRVIGIVDYSKRIGPHDFYYQAKMLEILDLLQKAYPKHIQQNGIPQGIDLYEQARRYIFNHYDNQISTKDLVNYLNIDRTYLYRIFVKNTGQSPQKCINEYRLKRASELLKSEEGTIEYVALSSGFKSYQSFIRLFKEKYGVAPSTFRKKYILKDTVKEIKKKSKNHPK